MNFEEQTNLNFVILSGTLKFDSIIRKNSLNKFVTYIQLLQDINRNRAITIPVLFNDKLAEIVSTYKKGDHIVFHAVITVIKKELTIIGIRLAHDPNR